MILKDTEKWVGAGDYEGACFVYPCKVAKHVNKTKNQVLLNQNKRY